MTTVAGQWLKLLHGRSPGYFVITPFENRKPVPYGSRWFTADQTGRAAAFVNKYADRYDMYVSVATHSEVSQSGRGSLKTAATIPGFWADIDIGTEGHKPASLPNPENEDQALSIVEGLPAPSAVIHSGGGLQLWWLFDEPWVFDDHTEAQRAADEWNRLLIERGEGLGYHVDVVGDLPRILRVPGTFNYKSEDPREVKLQFLDGPTYPMEELAALGLPTDSAEREELQAEFTDDFPFSWSEILEPHGYTIGGPTGDGPGRYVYRPGKKRSEGHSATIDNNGVPLFVNFSGSDSTFPSGPGHKLTKLKVWARLNYDGDLKSARKALKKIQGETPEQLNELAKRFAQSRLNFETLWTEEDPEPKWMVEPLIEYGRQIAIYSQAKTGKTLLSWDIVLGLVTGAKDFWGQSLPQVRVLYIDKENTKRDVREKFGKMGYEGETLPYLDYYSFPDLEFLDTEDGGQQLFALAKFHGAQLVIIDTLSRVVEGEENSNDTFTNFYKHTGVRLKAEGIAVVRLDHSGKDSAKGMRGASAKTTDVDEVWQLTHGDGSDYLILNRTHSRSNHGTERLVLSRRDDPKLHHEVLEGGVIPGQVKADVDEVETWLDLQQVPLDASVREAQDVWKAEGGRNTTGYTQVQVRDAQKRRKAQHGQA